MLRSKTCLVDVNVWLALAAERHEHHRIANRWFQSLGEETAAFCRVSQMGFLRLLSNPKVLAEDALEPVNAWDTYRRLRRDFRVTFAGEPNGLEALWVKLVRVAPTQSSWTDAYLAAMAIGCEYRLVTFDRGFRRWKQLRLELLSPYAHAR